MHVYECQVSLTFIFRLLDLIGTDIKILSFVDILSYRDEFLK